jgi:galactose mutarotase-like enzyme
MAELFPSLKEEVYREYALPGHGEIWQRAVEIDEATLYTGTVLTSYELESMPIRYTRRIELDGPAVRLEYIAENLSSRELSFLWALHPLFDLKPGDRFDADWETTELEVKASPGLHQFDQGDRFPWPGISEGIDLKRLFLKKGGPAGIKFFGPSPPEGKVALSNPESGALLRIRYDTDALPWLAVWLSRGVWDRAHHIAIEPTNRPGESIAETEFQNSQTGRLGPGGRRSWWIEFTNASNNKVTSQEPTKK